MARSLWQRGLIWSSMVALTVQMMVAAALLPAHAVAKPPIAGGHTVVGHFGAPAHAPEHDKLDPACQLWCMSQANCSSMTSLTPSPSQWQSVASMESWAMALRSNGCRPSHVIGLDPPPPRAG